MLPIPIRHGLTFGEEAKLIQGVFFPDSEVEVVPVKGWSRDMLWPEVGLPFVSSSPNTTTFEMTLLYPGTCLFEGTNVSLGRGTTHPFQWIGAPWADGHRLANWFNRQNVPGVIARPVYFTPWSSLYAGDLVSGVHIHITDPHRVHALKTGVTLILAFQTLYPNIFRIGSQDDGEHRLFFDLLAGGRNLREAIENNSIEQYFAEEPSVVGQFSQDVRPYLLYTE
jgi:uncharacterized protein YbbC (DUF1343 family)